MEIPTFPLFSRDTPTILLAALAVLLVTILLAFFAPRKIKVEDNVLNLVPLREGGSFYVHDDIENGQTVWKFRFINKDGETESGNAPANGSTILIERSICENPRVEICTTNDYYGRILTTIFMLLLFVKAKRSSKTYKIYIPAGSIMKMSKKYEKKEA
jgi:hypothetical protein